MSSHWVAVKNVPKTKQRLLASDQYYRQLYSRLPAIPHRNLLKLRDFFEDSDTFYIISDLCTGPDLVDYVLEFEPGAIPIETSKRLTFQILLGLSQLHKANILHRDIKLDNILFKDESRQQIQIIDFDMGLLQNVPTPPKCLLNPEEVSVVGTKDYMAPECYHGKYSRASDLWSLGIILFIFLDGHFPFNFASTGRSHRETREVLKRGIRTSSELRRQHPMAVDLMEKLLKLNPSERLQSAWEALSHPWFTPTPRPLLQVQFKDACNMELPLTLSNDQEALSNGEQGSRQDFDMRAKIKSYHASYDDATSEIVIQNYCTNNQEVMRKGKWRDARSQTANSSQMSLSRDEYDITVSNGAIEDNSSHNQYWLLTSLGLFYHEDSTPNISENFLPKEKQNNDGLPCFFTTGYSISPLAESKLSAVNDISVNRAYSISNVYLTENTTPFDRQAFLTNMQLLPELEQPEAWGQKRKKNQTTIVHRGGIPSTRKLLRTFSPSKPFGQDWALESNSTQSGTTTRESSPLLETTSTEVGEWHSGLPGYNRIEPSSREGTDGNMDNIWIHNSTSNNSGHHIIIETAPKKISIDNDEDGASEKKVTLFPLPPARFTAAEQRIFREKQPENNASSEAQIETDIVDLCKGEESGSNLQRNSISAPKPTFTMPLKRDDIDVSYNWSSGPLEPSLENLLCDTNQETQQGQTGSSKHSAIPKINSLLSKMMSVDGSKSFITNPFRKGRVKLLQQSPPPDCFSSLSLSVTTTPHIKPEIRTIHDHGTPTRHSARCSRSSGATNKQNTVLWRNNSRRHVMEKNSISPFLLENETSNISHTKIDVSLSHPMCTHCTEDSKAHNHRNVVIPSGAPRGHSLYIDVPFAGPADLPIMPCKLDHDQMIKS